MIGWGFSSSGMNNLLPGSNLPPGADASARSDVQKSGLAWIWISCSFVFGVIGPGYAASGCVIGGIAKSAPVPFPVSWNPAVRLAWLGWRYLTDRSWTGYPPGSAIGPMGWRELSSLRINSSWFWRDWSSVDRSGVLISVGRRPSLVSGLAIFGFRPRLGSVGTGSLDGTWRTLLWSTFKPVWVSRTGSEARSMLMWVFQTGGPSHAERLLSALISKSSPDLNWLGPTVRPPLPSFWTKIVRYHSFSKR